MTIGIDFKDVDAVVQYGGKSTVALRSASVTITKARYAVVAERDIDRAAFIDMLSGRMQPNRGTIRITGTRSFPIGRIAVFNLPLAGDVIVRHLAQVYGLNANRLLALFDECMMDNAIYMTRRVDKWPVECKIQFSLTAGLIRPWDIMIFDGTVYLAAMPGFMKKWSRLMSVRCENALMIISSRQKKYVERLADRVLLIRGGNIYVRELEAMGEEKALLESAFESSGGGGEEIREEWTG